jgi:hypothetical protein
VRFSILFLSALMVFGTMAHADTLGLSINSYSTLAETIEGQQPNVSGAIDILNDKPWSAKWNCITIGRVFERSLEATLTRNTYSEVNDIDHDLGNKISDLNATIGNQMNIPLDLCRAPNSKFSYADAVKTLRVVAKKARDAASVVRKARALRDNKVEPY